MEQPANETQRVAELVARLKPVSGRRRGRADLNFIANLIQNIDAITDLDFIMRKIFMNFTVTDQKVTKITQNSPFRELCVDADSAMVTPSGFEPEFAP